LQPARGQARIPSIDILEELVSVAKNEGWGDFIAE
jgi:nitrogen fixation protein